MGRFRYTPEMILFLRDGFKKHRLRMLTALFNKQFGTEKSESQIKSCLKNNKIKSGRKKGFKKGENICLLTPEQVDFVRNGYKKMSRKDLTSALNEKFGLSLKVSQVISFVKNHKIRSGRTGFFKKGGQSWNRGTKGYTGANRTSFKKGHMPKNHRPVGSERIDKDGYILVKVSERNPYSSSNSGWYRHKHVVLWEKYNGTVPVGHCVRFKDGDRTNITIENLVLVSRGENARLTKMEYGQQPNEIKPVLLNIARIDQAIFERSKSS
ncbi:hypothetical protein DGMP_06490 [Desulfomarina profundi]|uniref:HNH nuclease domain-containing protein n=1 Tax=Desulfomarina profundi TaxID=2772557 RepID=A0A8D5FG08_9BACT|nr:HNH endonuclease signature motif containing protein [Desulfomarina profundi]BCL59956.1 hypothetical protein DGMP_06490 [Desulfomarina profundi]